MIYATGYRSSVITSLRDMVSENVIRLEEGADVTLADKFVLAAGVIHPKLAHMQTPQERAVSAAVNLTDVIMWAEHILDVNDNARICIIGSMSAIKGSFDMVYAAAKAGVHAYAQMKQLRGNQVLKVVAPTLISDSSMVARRHDYPEVLTKRPSVTSVQVAAEVCRVLFSPKWVVNTDVVVRTLCPQQ